MRRHTHTHTNAHTQHKYTVTTQTQHGFIKCHTLHAHTHTHPHTHTHTHTHTPRRGCVCMCGGGRGQKASGLHRRYQTRQQTSIATFVEHVSVCMCTCGWMGLQGGRVRDKRSSGPNTCVCVFVGLCLCLRERVVWACVWVWMLIDVAVGEMWMLWGFLLVTLNAPHVKVHWEIVSCGERQDRERDRQDADKPTRSREAEGGVTECAFSQ